MNIQEKTQQTVSRFPQSNTIIQAAETAELFFAVVGHVGSGTSNIANTLKGELENHSYDVEIIKASLVIRAWREANGNHVPGVGTHPNIDNTYAYQDIGDLMREQTEDCAAVAQGLISEVRRIRANKTGVTLSEGLPVEPDNNKRAYVFDSIRHPSEVCLLRDVYHKSFTLIGVVCQEETRKSRLLVKYFEHGDQSTTTSKEKVEELMSRDADDKVNDHGQHVADAFFEADYFVNNSVDSKTDKEHWNINEVLGRLIDIVTHSRIIRPSISETAMHHAMTSQIRSACLSRQVGAALVDSDGDIIATGTNEAPKPGGGVYGESFDIFGSTEEDHRCFCADEKVCSSNREQNKLAQKIAEAIPGKEEPESLMVTLRKAGLKDLLEFSRAIHAEMDAVTTAARKGKKVYGSKMYVTTFPCHYCARHLVASGVHEVQYIEPYPKSLAMSLHKDAITSNEINWVPPGSKNSDCVSNDNYQKVLFKPFVGVAPRLYVRAFTKDRPLKNKNTGKLEIGVPEWGSKWNVKRISYVQLEAELTKVEKDVE